MSHVLRRKRFQRRGGVEINLAPLMDMVFILLIFFLVTTSFTRESGVVVERPRAKTAEPLEKLSFIIGVTEKGEIFVEGRRIEIPMIRTYVSKVLRENPDAGVVVVCDRNAKTDVLIRVLDECRAAGAKNLSVAARKAGSDGGG
ncbi:ExbD/TolR family protein [Thermodesulforhabdus norvegica]|uniref:Outer membrane transport energization protein ExbD (TC 2.C.1.1.1) n=1 Tax=Thermodesulforhabdus norvegica TaxID=39841 RepID=A0A1I4QWU0_9BACT|nr:biopolymer transporter ExbD [Thermodesulforhabdus norvegica]SFM44552.1 outer membrane transport energization protein ExbD (TC 2.C.1.1.1) [Thermodesulforhabdus norvegica]